MESLDSMIANVGIAGVAAGLLVLHIGLAVFASYLITLQNGVNALPAHKRPFVGNLVWLAIVPLFSLWYLLGIILISHALRDEIKGHNLEGDGGFLIAILIVIVDSLWVLLGIGYLATQALFFAISGGLLFVAGVVLWALHWSQVHTAIAELRPRSKAHA